MIDGRDTTVSTGAQDTLGSPAAARTSIAGPVATDTPTVRIAGSWRLTVRASRWVYAALFGCGSLAALIGARLSLASSPFSQFVVPTGCGVLLGLLLHPTMLASDREDDPVHLPDVIAQVGMVLFLSITLAQFLPPWTPSAWCAFSGGASLLWSALLHNDTRRAQYDRRIGP